MGTISWKSAPRTHLVMEFRRAALIKFSGIGSVLNLALEVDAYHSLESMLPYLICTLVLLELWANPGFSAGMFLGENWQTCPWNTHASSVRVKAEGHRYQDMRFIISDAEDI